MALTVGTRLGVYEVTAQIGQGGMGQVYRARDTTLSRDVALKILPDAFASDPDRLARFTREAQTLALLNHPHIAAIYGLEESSGVRALVMELVEGEDLSQRMTRGAIPLDEALPIAKQIAEALEAAHEQGIIHRDLKPANVKVRVDGTVKVLDFGLAKALEPAGGPSASAMNSPTLTAHGTLMGMILGTAAYMSPEQARGKVVDRRADLWAFGVVLYEMLTGRRAFGGEEISDVLAAVLKETPPLSALPSDTPEPIRRLLRRCLDKDRKRRLDSAAGARLEIEDALAGGQEDIRAIAPSLTATPIWRRVLPWAMAAVAFIAAGTTLLLWAPWRTASPPSHLWVSAELGADASLVLSGMASTPLGSAVAVSPDGTLLAFVAQPHGAGTSHLYVRRLDQLPATMLLGTEGAAAPFFSPDGRWLGFFGGGWLKKIAVTGGAPESLASVTNARGGNWGEDGTIIYTPGTSGGLWRVSAAGGTPAEQLTTPVPGKESTHRWPQVLPGGRAVLYTVVHPGSAASANLTTASLAVKSLPSGEPHIVRDGFYGRYLPSGLGSPTRAGRESGHLTWIQGGTLFAAPFDLTTLVSGPAAPVVVGVASSFNNGAQVDVSHTGRLVFVPGADSMSAAPLDWLSRDGKPRPLMSTPTNWSGVQIAPNGRQLALAIVASNELSQDVWTYDVAKGSLTQLTFDPATDRSPVWRPPDGQRLVYSSGRAGGQLNLWWQRADGSGAATQLAPSPNTQTPGSWDPSGHVLAFHENRPGTGADVLTLQIEGDEASGWKVPKEPIVFLGGRYNEQLPRFSPDGQWLAYESDETGTSEIYVQPFPGPGGKWRVSNGGKNAIWSRARPWHELLYRAPDGRIMVVNYTTANGAFQHDHPVVWSETPIQLRPYLGAFDLDPDGTRVVMAPETQSSAALTHVNVWINFFDELRRLAPVTKR